MSLSKGVSSIRRVHGKNYTHEQVQKRLDEAVKPMQQQGLNALHVDSHEVELYLNTMSSRVCTCKQVQSQITEMDLENTDPVKLEGISQETEITINWAKPLFGEPNEATFDDNHSYDEYELDNEESSSPSPQSSIIESSPDCGICYRTGFVPGLEQYGKTRFVFTSHDLVDQNLMTINRSLSPHVFDRLHTDGWALFQVVVPKYFRSLTYSVRNGYEILNEQLWAVTGKSEPVRQLSLADIRASAGKAIWFRVRAKHFTHAVLTFDLGTDPILANIAQLSKMTDWTLFETIGNLNVILPMTIPELPVGSIIIAPKTGIGMRITDVPHLRTSKGHNIDWSATVRVMQPQEPAKSINKGFRMF